MEAQPKKLTGTGACWPARAKRLFWGKPHKIGANAFIFGGQFTSAHNLVVKRVGPEYGRDTRPLFAQCSDPKPFRPMAVTNGFGLSRMQSM